MSEITQFILTNGGFSTDILSLILLLPVIGTVVNIARYIFGFKTFGIYAPITLAYALYFTGLRYGLVITLSVIIATIFTYYLLKQIRMHYISRISTNYVIITFIIIAFTIIYQWIVGPIETIPFIGIILIAAISDYFIKSYVKHSLTSTFIGLSETFIIATIGFYLLRTNDSGSLLLDYPWLILTLIPINIFIGRYSGLRIKEFLRFRQIVTND